MSVSSSHFMHLFAHIHVYHYRAAEERGSKLHGKEQDDGNDDEVCALRSGFEEMTELQHRLNHLFESAATRGEATGSSTPAVDVYEDAQRLVLKLEVPGVKRSELDLRIENQVLTVKGQRGFEAEEKEENFHRIERRFGSFTRSFTLPQTVDTSAVQAIYLDGVLAVTIAKKAEAKPRQIQVEIGAAAAPASAVEVEGQR